MKQLEPPYRGTSSVLQPLTIPMHVSADNGDISIAQLFRTLRKRKLLIVFVILLATGLALGASLYMTPKYEATAVIEVNKEASDMIGDAMSSMMDGSASDGLDYNVTLQTHARALQSDSLVFLVANQLGLEKREEFQLRPGISLRPISQEKIDEEYRKPLEQSPLRRTLLSKTFEKNLTIKTVPGTRLIEVHFLNPDPQVAANVVNTLVNDYLEQYFKTRYAATAQASEWLSKQLADMKAQVDDSEQKLVDYQKKTGLLGTDDEVNNWIVGKLESMDKELRSAEMDRIMAETVSRLIKAGNPELISAATAGSGQLSGGTGPNANRLSLLQSLRVQEAQLKMQYAQASTKYGAAFPALVQMRSQMKELDGSIQTEMDKLSARAENDYLIAKTSEDRLRESFEKEKVVANQLNDAAVHYTIQKHEVSANRELYDTLLTKLKSAGILSGLRSTNVVVVDPARTTPDPARPIYPLNVGLGLALGLVGGIALAFVREGADNTIRSPEQAEEISDLPTLTVIPEFKGAGWGKGSEMGVSVLDHPSSPMAEAYRSLRTSILLSKIDRPPKVIMITSALPQDGKSTTSINMAITLAQQGSKVLLVDADLRRPKLKNMSNISSEIGLSTLMTSSDSELPVYQSHSTIPNLSILTAGVRTPYPAELLGSQRMAHLVKYWREQYDFIVIDTPPVLAVADPVVVSQYADAILFVIRYQQTTKQSLVRSRDLLLRANAKIAGLVLNRMNTNSPDHYYSYGYYSSQHKGYYNDARN